MVGWAYGHRMAGQIRGGDDGRPGVKKGDDQNP